MFQDSYTSVNGGPEQVRRTSLTPPSPLSDFPEAVISGEETSIYFDEADDFPMPFDDQLDGLDCPGAMDGDHLPPSRVNSNSYPESGKLSVDAKRRKSDSFNSLHGSVVTKIPLERIQVDPNYIPRTSEIPELTLQYVDVLRSGTQFPPIVIEAGTRKLIDGFHRLQAYKERKAFYDRGEWSDEGPSEREIGLIPYVYEQIPGDFVPRLFNLKYNMTHGHRASSKDIERAIQEQYAKKPGSPVKKVAKLLSISEDTVRKYSKPQRDAWRAERNALVKELSQDGFTQEKIPELLKERWPDASQISQAMVSAILSEKPKTGKTYNEQGKFTLSTQPSGSSDNSSVELAAENGVSENPSTDTSCQDGTGSQVIVRGPSECDSIEEKAITQCEPPHGPEATEHPESPALEVTPAAMSLELRDPALVEAREAADQTTSAVMDTSAGFTVTVGSGGETPSVELPEARGTVSLPDTEDGLDSPTLEAVEESKTSQHCPLMIRVSQRERDYIIGVRSLPDPLREALWNEVEALLRRAEAKAQGNLEVIDQFSGGQYVINDTVFGSLQDSSGNLS